MMTRARLQPLLLPAITILIAFAVHVSSSSPDDTTVDAVALTAGSPSNASDSWKQLLFNQAKYDHRYAAEQHKTQAPQLQQKPGFVGLESAASSDVSFEEQDYRLEDVLMRTGQMIELLGLSNYLPRYMRFERPPQAANKRDAANYKDYDQEDDDNDNARRRNQPSLEQLLKVEQRQSTGKRLRRRRHRSSRRGRRRRGRQANRDSNSNNQLVFLRRPQRRRLRRYLLEATACRVSRSWRDLGKAFWPRWLRQGECRQPPGGSCSIPSGMRCKPASRKRLYVLRYLCARHWHRSQCRWVRQSLQVLQSCECSCS